MGWNVWLERDARSAGRWPLAASRKWRAGNTSAAPTARHSCEGVQRCSLSQLGRIMPSLQLIADWRTDFFGSGKCKDRRELA